MFKKLQDNEQIVIVVISGILFSLINFYDISTIIIYTMSFLVLLEAVRSVVSFVLDESHKIKLRYVIDGAILFGVRELFVGWVMLKKDFNEGFALAAFSFFLILGLVFIRIIAVKNSPDILEKITNQTKNKNINLKNE